MNNLTVMDTQVATQDINLTGDINSKYHYNFINNDNNNMRNTNSTNATCAVTLCISSIIRYIASCIVHEIQCEQA